MGNKVIYEWDIETVDSKHRDVLDHNHSDAGKLKQLIHCKNATPDFDGGPTHYELVLVRNVTDCCFEDSDREWCYEQFQEGKGFLPKTFGGYWVCACDHETEQLTREEISDIGNQSLKNNHLGKCNWIEYGTKVPQKLQKEYEKIWTTL